MSFLLRVAVGAAAAAMIAWFAYRAGSLSRSGAVAATAVGTAAVAAGWGWGALLVLYFAGSVLLSRWESAAKGARAEAVVAKGGARDATQVLANGGAFAALALLSRLAPAASGTAAIAALGALAASTADTWATEVGLAAKGPPRSLLTLRPVPPGTSGGVSLRGSVAMMVGAGFVALTARTLGLAGALAAVTVGGVAGALADTVLGATVQERRWCATCAKGTERLVHGCGTATTHAGGLTWLDNDAVNFAATLAGALVAALLAHLSPALST